MQSNLNQHETITGIWDEEHVKALLRFPRFPSRLIQQEPWQRWIGQRGGLKAVFNYLQSYPLSPTHHRILEVVLSTPEAVADVYADRLNISRATYFYQLRELVPALVHALNHWEIAPRPEIVPQAVNHPSLPVALTNLVGVESTLSTLSRLLTRSDVRLLTLLGPGGIGKTRLALELAHRYHGNAGFVDLSGVHDHNQVVAIIAQTLGVKEASEAGLKVWLRSREFFLVLDNFEQIIPARSLLPALLTAAPQLKILVTSRVALHVYGEHEFVVPPLATSDIQTVKNQQLWAQSPAVALFVQRAQAVNPNFVLNNENVEAVTELCLRTEGLPLAIELAAFQAKYYSPQCILNRMCENRLNFLSQDNGRMPPHQKTLRAMLDWSFNLLPPPLQTLFCRLSAFSDIFSIEDAETVCDMENIPFGLATLVDHSLLEQHTAPNGEPLFQLFGLAKEYACERLERVHA